MIKTQKFAIAMFLITLGFGLFGVLSLPLDTQIATHFNAQGEADGFSSALVGFLILPVAQLGTLALLMSLRFIDPRVKNIKHSEGAIGAMSGAIGLILAVAQLKIVAHAHGIEVLGGTGWILSAIGASLIIIGNMLPKTRSNFFIGIRTPWTLSSEDNWRKTHRLAGPLVMLSGIGLIVLPHIGLGLNIGELVVFTVIPMALIPALYSFIMHVRSVNDDDDGQEAEA